MTVVGPRPPKAQPSVFARLRMMLIGVFVIGGTVAVLAAWAFSVTAANETYDRLLISAAAQIAETLSVDQNGLTVAPPEAAFQTLALARGDRVFYAVRAPDGSLLTGNVPPGTLSGPASSDEPRISDGRRSGLAVRIVSLGRHVTTPRGAGWASVTIAQTREARARLARLLLLKMSTLILAISGLGFFAALAAARRALRPLARIEEALAKRDAHDVTPLEVESPRETQALVDAINVVMARFGDRMAKLQSFTGVAAHQIRTPIAALLAQAELLESDHSDTSRRQRAERIRLRLGELGRLTNQLLGHAMISYRAETVPPKRIDLVDAARDALRDGAPLAPERDLAIEFDAPDEPVWIDADVITLREGLSNIINNAVVHGAPSQLIVTVRREAAEAIVAVFDDGPGIPADQWSEVAKPFAAPRGARPGAGLGLSIAREIATTHGGDLRLRFPSGGGFEVALAFPSAPAP